MQTTSGQNTVLKEGYLSLDLDEHKYGYVVLDDQNLLNIYASHEKATSLGVIIPRSSVICNLPPPSAQEKSFSWIRLTCSGLPEQQVSVWELGHAHSEEINGWITILQSIGARLETVSPTMSPSEGTGCTQSDFGRDCSTPTSNCEAPWNSNSGFSSGREFNPPPAITTPHRDYRRSGKWDKKESVRSGKEGWRLKKRGDGISYDLDSPTTFRGWIKYRRATKKWSLRFFVLSSTALLYFKDEVDVARKKVQGIVYLRGCVVGPRQSKKEGFCFKVEHTGHQSIYGVRGLLGEPIASAKVPIGQDQMILRVVSADEGMNWVGAIRGAIERSVAEAQSPCISPHILHGPGKNPSPDVEVFEEDPTSSPLRPRTRSQPVHPLFSSDTAHRVTESESELSVVSEKAASPDTNSNPAVHTDFSTAQAVCSTPVRSQQLSFRTDRIDTSPVAHRPVAQRPPPCSTIDGTIFRDLPKDPPESNYVLTPPPAEPLVDAWESGKSLILQLMKQVRPGMDLSRVVLPTHILEPRSLLEKVSDYFAHVQLLNSAVKEPDPLDRMIGIVRWYMSGFYIKPKGIKKPYNPILGEVYRCMWISDPPNNARIILIGEQVSHHPPVSAFYVSNREDGWIAYGSWLIRSKFWGTSAGALFSGTGKLYLPYQDEEYEFGFPSFLSKGFIIGPLSMEVMGLVKINCPKTGYNTRIEFKIKPLISGERNHVSGKIRKGKDVLYTIRGKFDEELVISDVKTKNSETFWKPTPEVQATRLQRYVIPMEEQEEFESERIWDNVTKAIVAGDQHGATDGKTKLEQEQRARVRVHVENHTEHITRLFERTLDGAWMYKWPNFKPQDPKIWGQEYESNWRILSTRRVKAVNGLIADAPSSFDPTPVQPVTSESPSVTGISDDSQSTSHSKMGEPCSVSSNLDTTSVPPVSPAETATVSRSFESASKAFGDLSPALQLRKRVDINDHLDELENRISRIGHGQKPVVERDTWILMALLCLCFFLFVLLVSFSRRVSFLEKEVSELSAFSTKECPWEVLRQEL